MVDKQFDPSTNPVPEHLKMEYDEISKGYHAIREIRFKLVGFLPLASSGIFLLFTSFTSHGNLGFLLPIGCYGICVTLGLYFYEQENMKQSHDLVERGKGLETDIGIENGAFSIRDKIIKAEKFIWRSSRAAAFIYVPTLLAWFLVAGVGFWHLLGGQT